MMTPISDMIREEHCEGQQQTERVEQAQSERKNE